MKVTAELLDNIKMYKPLTKCTEYRLHVCILNSHHVNPEDRKSEVFRVDYVCSLIRIDDELNCALERFLLSQRASQTVTQTDMNIKQGDAKGKKDERERKEAD